MLLLNLDPLKHQEERLKHKYLKASVTLNQIQAPFWACPPSTSQPNGDSESVQ